MKPTPRYLLTAVFLGCLLVLTAPARDGLQSSSTVRALDAASSESQKYQQGGSYNPYTGGYVRKRGYNPYTGAGSRNTTVNPFTGRKTPGQPTINPFTGKAIPRKTSRNPITGQYQSGLSTNRPGTVTTRWPEAKSPITGKAGPGLEAFDKAVLSLMKRHGIPGASLAIAKDGKLVYAKGFGWADLRAGFAVDPETMFALGSLSKPITAMAIMLLVEQEKLRLDDYVFEILKHIRPPGGFGQSDPRWKKVTVRQLLNHSGGWDRQKSGDPINWEAGIARALKVPVPISDTQFISFMLTQKVDFEPGSQMSYSNIGYILLGEIIEKVGGEPYETFVRKNILKRAGVVRTATNSLDRSYQTNEAHRYLSGASTELPPMGLPFVAAAGGWRLSSVDMVRILTAYDGSRGAPLLKNKTYQQMLAPPPPPIKPKKNGAYNGLGWPLVAIRKEGSTYIHDGLFHGVRTFAKRSEKGINWALFFNVSMQPDQVDAKIIEYAIEEVRHEVESLEKYPDIDLFGEF